MTGLAVGGAVAVLVTRAMGSLLYDISTTDPATFALLSLLLFAVALLASYVPEHRATRLDPLAALRSE